MKVPQINENTGVSSDYWNEYVSHITTSREGIKTLAEWFKEYPIRKYEQRFPTEKYEDAITPQNINAIRRLNELSDIVNANFTDPLKLTEDKFKKTITEVCHIIFGEKRNPYFPEITKEKTNEGSKCPE
jgi:hypothetical protein